MKRFAAAIVILYALGSMVPLAWIFATGFKKPSDSIAYPPRLWLSPSIAGYCNLFTATSRQTDEYIASLPPPSGACDRIARARHMVIVGSSNFVPRFFNSLVIAFGSTALSVLLGLTAAYGFSR